MCNLRFNLFRCSLLFGLTFSLTADAAPPWKNIGFKRKGTTNPASLRLLEKHGPWLIYASSFAGNGAQREAEQLAIELRNRYKLRAYVYSQKFDFTESVNGIGINGDRSPKRMRYNSSGEFDEIAVLVGDFSTVDDPKLQKTLDAIKHLNPQSLTKAGEDTTRRFAGLRKLQQRVNGDKSKKRKGPMRMAFATPNPLVPRESYAPKGVDSFVLKLNKKVEHSLLKCPAKYSVRVATFRGTVVTNQQKIQEIKNGGRLKSALEEAADKAHRLTVALRQRGFEAYEFHDRHESYVTVGHYDWAGSARPDGKQEINPAILRVMNQFGASNFTKTGMTTTNAQPKRLNGISFDSKPWPVVVPRQSLAADYSPGRSFLRR